MDKKNNQKNQNKNKQNNSQKNNQKDCDHAKNWDKSEKNQY
ncbi:hypothetical protein ACPW7J_12565 [Ihubacter sp. rT4E-8]